MTQSDIHRAEPIYEELPGWWEDISTAARVRRSSGEGAGLRVAAGRACWCACFVHRRGPRVVSRRSCGATSWRASMSECESYRPRSARWIPGFEPADPGPGFERFLTAMRRAQDLAVSADPDSDTWDDAADRVEELVKLLDPYQAAEGLGPANRMPSLPGCGQPADAAVDHVEVRARRRRIARAVQPVSRRRQLCGARRCAAAVVRFGVRHGDPCRGPPDQPDRFPTMWTTAR